METAAITSLLQERGYTCCVEHRCRYCGSKEPEIDVITAIRENCAGIVSEGPPRHFTRLRKALQSVPLAAQIIDVFDLGRQSGFALFDKIEGTLVWHLEGSDRPQLSSVESALHSFVSSLRPLNLVHADIRPWNIIFRPSDSAFRFIDWGFSFFAGEPKAHATCHLNDCNHCNTPVMEIDHTDMKRTITTLRNPSCFESLYKYPNTRFKWRPEPW